MNRMANASNQFQGDAKRVLCVCSAGLLRSPTAAKVLGGEPWNYNTRAAGLVSDFALIVVDEVLLHWADEVVCMNEAQATELRSLTDKPVIVLDIQDNYRYMDPDLVEAIKSAYTKALVESRESDA